MRRPLPPVALGVALVVAACVTVPGYDATTDAAISALQRKVDGRLVALMSAADATDAAARQGATYAANIGFYDEVDTDLTALAMRMETVKDRSTANFPQIFDDLGRDVAQLRATHKADGTIPAPVLATERKLLNQNFAVLLTYELALRSTHAMPGK